MVVNDDVIAGVVVFVAIGRVMITVIGRMGKRKNQDVNDQHQAYPDGKPVSLETCLERLHQIDDQISAALSGGKIQDAYKQFGHVPDNGYLLQKVCELDSDFRKITVRMANLLHGALGFLHVAIYRFDNADFGGIQNVEDFLSFRDNLEKIASITLHTSGRGNYLEEVQKAFAKIEAIHQSLASAQVAPIAAVDPR